MQWMDHNTRLQVNIRCIWLSNITIQLYWLCVFTFFLPVVNIMQFLTKKNILTNTTKQCNNNAAPNPGRATCDFTDGCSHSLLCLSHDRDSIDDMLNQHFQILMYCSVRPLATDFQSSSCLISHISTLAYLSHGFPSFRTISYSSSSTETFSELQ